MDGPTEDRQIIRYNEHKAQDIVDKVAVEEPLQILLSATQHSPPVNRKNISITMRTPGEDRVLAVGFLYSEGIINANNGINVTQERDNQVLVEVAGSLDIDLSHLERHFYATSSCGVCGKASLEAVRSICMPEWPAQSLSISKSLILSLPEKMATAQATFNTTGGLHAVALFDSTGLLVNLKEDVGRHNALDKLIGTCILEENEKAMSLPLSSQILLLSGRASFELIQKAVMAGIKVVLAIGAPSSLAISLAEDHDVTLVGFLKENRFNVYSGSKRLSLS